MHYTHNKDTNKENMMPEHLDHPGCEDEIGQIYVVLKPGPESSPEDLVHQTHAFGMGQFEPQGVHGVYGDEAEANLVAEAACNELRKHLEEVEGKKHTVTEKIDKIINKLQKEINLHMKEASELPESADKSHSLAERKMATIKKLREKRKMVEASKKPLEEINEGLFGRLGAQLKGAGAQATTSFKNLGAAFKGDKDAIQDPKLAKNVAILKQKAIALKKDLEEMQRDMQKLFPSDIIDKLPKDFVGPLQSYLKSLDVVKDYNDRFATGNIVGQEATVGTKKQPAAAGTKVNPAPSKRKTPVVSMQGRA